MRPTRRLASLFAALALAACGGKGDDAKPKDDAPAGPTAAPLVMPALGVDHVRRMNFVYGDGWTSYDKAVAAYKKKDLDAAKAHAESAISKDPLHLDAHWLLARIFAARGAPAAVDHLVTALAGDYYAYATDLATSPELAELRATAHGQAVAALAAKLDAEYAKRVPAAMWLLARRSTYKWPKDFGTQSSTSRGELYAYDRELKRFFRLTHTNHRVLAYVRAPSGKHVAIIGFDKIDREKPGEGTPTPPSFAAAWIQVIDATTWQPVSGRIALGAAREIAFGYDRADQLVVSTQAPSGERAVSTVDAKSSKLAKTEGGVPSPTVVLSLEEGRVLRDPEGVTASWTGTPATASSLQVAGGAAIAIPESGATHKDTVAVSPDGARVAFVTAVDPCAKDTAPSLYVADAKAGTHRHVLTSRSRFAPRWLDANLLAYEDGEGAIRVWDASRAQQAWKIDNKPGIALDVLTLQPAPRCVTVPALPTEEPGPDDEPPLPPEEPVTKPT